MEKKEMVFGTRAVMEAIKAGREIEKIYIQAGLNNDLIRELITSAQTHSTILVHSTAEAQHLILKKSPRGYMRISHCSICPP